jgi:hypothetical protein
MQKHQDILLLHDFSNVIFLMHHQKISKESVIRIFNDKRFDDSITRNARIVLQTLFIG